MKYYVFYIWGDVEPETPIGPFKTRGERDTEALALRRKVGSEDGGIYMLDISASGVPSISSYSGGFFEEVDSSPADFGDVELE